MLFSQQSPKFPWRFYSGSIFILSALFWASFTSAGSAKPISASDHKLSLAREDQLAQLFYPQPSENQRIQVIGIGEASQSADRAAFTLQFAPKGNDSGLRGMQTALTQTDLEPILAALEAEGITVIETEISQPSSQGLPFPIPGTSQSGGAEIVVALENPEPEDLDRVIEIVKPVGSDRVTLKTAKVQFELDNCAALERETYQAAVEDAQNRAEAIADSIGATLEMPSVSEPFYTVALPGCSLRALSFLNQPQTYKPGMETELQLVRQLFLSYPTVKRLPSQ